MVLWILVEDGYNPMLRGWTTLKFCIYFYYLWVIIIILHVGNSRWAFEKLALNLIVVERLYL